MLIATVFPDAVDRYGDAFSYIDAVPRWGVPGSRKDRGDVVGWGGGDLLGGGAWQPRGGGGGGGGVH